MDLYLFNRNYPIDYSIERADDLIAMMEQRAVHLEFVDEWQWREPREPLSNEREGGNGWLFGCAFIVELEGAA